MLRPAITLTMLLGALNLVAGPTSAADVYKYTDEKGNVLYTDKPRTLPAERLNVQTAKRSDTPAAQPNPSDELKRMQDADAARKQAATEKATQSQSAQSSAKDRLDRCTKARDRYETYITSRKMYEETTPGGERRYLTSEELDAARATAKTSMDAWCK